MGMVHRHRGTADGGIALVAPMIETLAGSGPSSALTSLYLALSNLVFFTGRYREMLEAARRAGNLGVLLPILAWAQLERGDSVTAARTAAAAVERTRDQALHLLEALRVQGMVLVRQGQTEEAAHTLTEGREKARSLPYPYAEARILYHLGLLEQERGETEQAQTRLEEALLIFRQLGAGRDVERTEQTRAVLPRSANLAR
jgi:tetratricopeptide (TPR) repeat protein